MSLQHYFIGWHQPCNGPSGCSKFDYTMVSVNRLIKRRSPFLVQNWIMDSGAFTNVFKNGGYAPNLLPKYAAEVVRWSNNGNLMAAVTQDYMCESFILDKTGLTIAEHQRFTIYRYEALRKLVPNNIYIMPVLQGFKPEEYVSHIRQYGDRLKFGAWVGVGSVCKRNGSPSQVEAVLLAIHRERPDLKLHGFGLKRSSLQSPIVWDLLHSADSQAHSFHERKARSGKANCPVAAANYAAKLRRPNQLSIWASAA